MLELKNITKDYVTLENAVHALKGISLAFRKNEFVSILGPSGCGKTTLLNIIGGLDRYTDGDLIIENTSTKLFSDHDWDSYRNHSIGFVFQSYNLIPHLNVLQNVEISLTLAGISKQERRQRAKKVLKDVGLEEQIHKKPNQLSGGQMQRVAIARALVNDPSIILADEPTGALDSETSVQVMEILKEVAKDRLVIMVTHNNQLAAEYSTRIISLVDGLVINDTMPYEIRKEILGLEESKNKTKRRKKETKTSMSFKTAVGLSIRNMLSKKTRTFLTALAGSIGIIGIALVLSVSSGFQAYIDNVEENTLSSYPLVIDTYTTDFASMMESMRDISVKEEDREANTIYGNNVMGSIFSAALSGSKSNDLRSFKTYLDSKKDDLKDHITDIVYGYNAKMNVYSADGKITNDFSAIQAGLQMIAGETADSTAGFDYLTSSINVWSEAIDNQELLDSQYEVLDGNWPKAYNEVIIVVDKDYSINDYMLFALGLEDMSTLMQIFMNKDNPDYVQEVKSFTYEELLSLTFKVLVNSDYYEKQVDDTFKNKKDDNEFVLNKLNNAIELKVVGIVKLKDDVSSGALSSTMVYTKALTEKIIEKNNDSEVVRAQVASLDKSVIDGSSINDLTYRSLLIELGKADLDEPSLISIYPSSFESKEIIVKLIEEYNNDKDEEDKIQYTDYISLILSSVTDIVNAITYILIAFVAISLVVSSVMIGIINYTSVLERTKEIGVLRSVGASKNDISQVFISETMMIGFSSGLLGIGVSLLLLIPINLIINSLASIGSVAKLPFVGAIILIAISTLLTTFAGLVPARIASNKDPVIALRSE